ncbi:MAG: hypothetical protein JXL97_18190 [Bacteroidales bacterium]|nr:hypothetical protein [Bacteroidales bacterium]
MKSFFTTLVFLVVALSVYSQVDINSPFFRQVEFIIYQDSSTHTQIKPYLYGNSKVDSTNNWSLTVKPVFSLKQNFDIKNNFLANDYRGGVNIETNYRKKLQLNAIYYIGTLKPESFFAYKSDSLGVVPGFGKVISNKNGRFTYHNFVGNLIYKPQDYFYFEIGNGKTFLGDGYRSLLLSDIASPYPYFKAVVEVWKIKYFYMASRQKNYDFRFPEQQFTPKYTFTHYLSFNVGKRLNFSLFEAVVTSPYDSLMAKRGLDVNYLNPVIFFRPVEYSQGSPDNVVIGFSGHLKIFKSGMLYGQVFIDEFIRSHITSTSEEYWDEKYGIQAGMKFYRTFGIKNLYTQGEINAVRPYTYSHLNPIRNYGHMYESLAHPLGSNFIEGIGIIGYQYQDLFFQAKLVYARYGENDSLNYGRNQNISYLDRVGNKDILWLQGVSTTFKYADFLVGYRKWNTQFSLNFIYRNVWSSQETKDNLMIMVKIETPIFGESLDYN